MDRQKVVDIMKSWEGLSQKAQTHRPIIDTYNTIKPLPRGQKMTYTAPYCATTVSSAYHKAGYDSIFPLECSCNNMIEKAKKMGCWVEADDYVPKIADCLMYDWQDAKDGKGENVGVADHVGMVISINGNNMVIMEGNKGSNGVVGRRNMKVNGACIRGYVTPNFGDSAPIKNKPIQTTSKSYPTLNVGSRGELVKQLNIKLHSLKYGTDVNSDLYSQLTKACVTHYQKVNGLKVDGIAGAETLSSLGL